MAPKAKENSVTELETQVENEVQKAEDQVDEVGTLARKAAEKAGLSETEVNRRVEAARKEEKDKLYPQLEELKKAVVEVQEALRAEKQEKEQLKKDKQEAEERQRQESLSTEDRTNEMFTRIEEQLKDERKARESAEKRYAREKREAELKEYRKNAIQATKDAGNELLPELVKGDTEEEIDASIEHAVARYVELAERFKEELGQDTRKKMPKPTSPSMEALEEEELSEQLNAIDINKYQKDPDYKDQIQEQLAEFYARSQGMS